VALLAWLTLSMHLKGVRTPLSAAAPWFLPLHPRRPGGCVL